jgi:hypothetical protein
MTITLTREEAQQVLDALNRSDYLGWQVNIPITKMLRARLSAPEPEPVGWIYEDDEGRMMFSQMPQNPPLWEPVYRNQIKGKPMSSRTHTPEDIKKIQERWEEPVAGGLVRFRDSWVGLTDEEILAFVVHKEDRSLLRFARAIEEALREKNS